MVCGGDGYSSNGPSATVSGGVDVAENSRAANDNFGLNRCLNSRRSWSGS